MSKRGQSEQPYRAPSDCPVCGGDLRVIRLGCPSCGTEIAGDFVSCEFCALAESELDVLKVFLASRGNLRGVAKHLGVSYPTARGRLTDVLTKLGLAGDGGVQEGPLTRDQVLSEVASGALTPEEAASLLADLE